MKTSLSRGKLSSSEYANPEQEHEKCLCVETLYDEPKSKDMVKRKSRPQCGNRCGTVIRGESNWRFEFFRWCHLFNAGRITRCMFNKWY